MVKNVVKILDSNKELLGTGLLLNHCVVTVDHILGKEENYFIKNNNYMYMAQVLYRGKDLFIDIAMLSVEIQDSYIPEILEVKINDNVETKGFPQGTKYSIYPEGRHISGKVISFNYIDVSDKYCYCGNYITISSTEEITKGFSGSPVFSEDALVGFIARMHIDGKPNNFNVIPVSYFLEMNNGAFRNLFGEYVDCDIHNIINKPKKSLMNPFHFRSETIAFYGRSEQIDQIFQFCSSTPIVQWWAITGVGGIGKSRLAYEFAKSLNRNVWDVIMLNTYDYESLRVRTTNIRKNKFIVLDYVQQNIQNIGRWLYELSEKNFDYKVRILLLERYGRSYKTSKWIERINERNCEYDVLMNICYNPMMQLDPLFLELSSLSKDDLISIAQSYYYYKKNAIIDSSIIQFIIEQLGILDPGFNRPLYLIFLVDTWIDNGDLSKWNKTFILESVLKRELHRIKLIIKNVFDDDLLIKAYLNVLVYSTILDGLEYPNDFKIVCFEELNIFNESMEYHRKDIIEFFQQIGFLSMDSEGKYFFDGLKPDLLGEYYIFNNYTNSLSIEKIIRRSLMFPQRAFSFYNRLIDDYSVEIDSNFRTLLVNMDSNGMSSEQVFYFAEYLCERIVRDSRKYLKQSFDRLSILYVHNKNDDIAGLYAFALSNMIIEYNLKKNKSLVSKLENLYFEYSRCIDIAIEYASSLVQVIERKSVHASKKDFENLKKLYEEESLKDSLEINLYYAKALKILCLKSVSSYNSWRICRELKGVFQKFSENDELLFWYGQCLCGIDTNIININIILSELIELCSCALQHSHHISWDFYKLIKSVFQRFSFNDQYVFLYAKCLCSLSVNKNNIDNILMELLSLCTYAFVRPIYVEFIVEMCELNILSRDEALHWLKGEYDLSLYRKQIEKYFLIKEKDLKEEKKEKKYKVKIKTNINEDLNKAKKLAWLSNNLNYKQCKNVVEEIKLLYEEHKDIFEFSEYYLTGLVTLAKHPDQDLIDLQKLLENILKISNKFFKQFQENFRISIYETISQIAKYDLFTKEILFLLNSFVNKVVKDIRSEEETSNIMEMLLMINKLNVINVEDYFENIVVNHYQSEIIQRQYVKYLKGIGSFDLEYILKKLFLFYSLNCTIIANFLVSKIQYTSDKVDKKVLENISDFLSQNKMILLANVYSKLILNLFLKSPRQEYCTILHDLELEYRPNTEIAENYAKLLFRLNKEEIVDNNDIYAQFQELIKYYSNINIILLFQKILSGMVADSVSNKTFMKYINEQKTIYDEYETLELAIEYCKSLATISRFISENENKNNLIKVKKIRNYFKKKDFLIHEKMIINQIVASKNYIETEEMKLKDEELRNLKNEIQYLYLNKNILDVPMVILVVEKARKTYLKFSNVDFALQLSKVLYLLIQVVSEELFSDIIAEMDIIYNQYIFNQDIFEYYMKTFKYAVSANCDCVKDKMDDFEKILVQKVKEDNPYDGEVFKTLLFILHIKNTKRGEEQLIDLDIDCIKIPFVYADTKPSKEKVDVILNYFYIWKTLDRPLEIISINNQYILLSGYDRWFVAKNRNIKVIEARILAEY